MRRTFRFEVILVLMFTILLPLSLGYAAKTESVKPLTKIQKTHKPTKRTKQKRVKHKKPARAGVVQESPESVDAVPTENPVTVIPVELPQINSTDELNTLITIGSGTGQTKEPFFQNAANCYESGIYTAAQIGQAGTITTLGLNASTAGNWTGTGIDTIEIWMKETTLSVFPSAQSWNTFSTGATMVYRSTATQTFTTGWNTWPFQTVFPYGGVNNLMIMMRSHIASHSSGNNGWKFTNMGTAVADTYSTTSVTNWATAAVANGSLCNDLLNVQLNIAPPLGPVTAPIPADLATGIPTNATLSWTAATNGYGTIHYDLRFDVVTPPVTTVATGITATSFVPTINPTTTYYWQVIAHDTSVASNSPIWSFTTSAGVAPLAPSTGAFVSSDSNSITISWLDNAPDETGFPVSISTDGMNFPAPTVTVPSSGGTGGTVTWTETSSGANVHHWYRIFAIGAGGTSTDYASVNGWSMALTPTVAPGDSAAVLTSVILLMHYPAGNPLTTQYAIYDSISNRYVQTGRTLNSTVAWQSATTWGNTVTVTGLTTGTPYAIKIKARNGVNAETGYSPAVYFTPNGLPLPYTQDWTGFNQGTTQPSGWTRSRTVGQMGSGGAYNSNWRDTTTTGSPPNWAFLPYYDVENEDEVDRLISPAFNTTGVSAVEVDFNYGYVEESADDTLKFAFTVDNAATWHYLWVRGGADLVAGDGDDTDPPSSFEAAGLAQIALPSGALNQPVVKFGLIGVNEYGQDIFVSNFHIYPITVPRIAFSPTNLSFGTRLAGSPSTTTLYVYNNGAGVLNISNVTSTTVTPDWTSSIITAGDSAALTVTWDPEVPGSLTDALVFTSNASNGPTNTVNVTGNAVVPLSLPVSQNFSGTTFPPTDWTIINPDGDYTWDIYTGPPNWATIDFWGYEAAGQIDYLVTPLITTVGITAAECDFNWSYDGGSLGTYNDGLELAYSVDGGTNWNTLWIRYANDTPSLVAGTGTDATSPATSDYGLAQVPLPVGALNQPSLLLAFIGHNDYGPDIFVTNVNVYSSAGPFIAVSPTAIAFTNVTAGTTVNSTVYVKNSGTDILHVSSITASTVTPAPTTMTLAVGDSSPVTVTWSPTTTMTLADNLVINSDAVNNTALQVPVTGNSSAATINNTTFSPPAGQPGTSFTFNADFSSQIGGITVDSVKAFVTQNYITTSYLLGATGGSIPGTIHYSGNVVLNAVGVTTFTDSAYYQNSGAYVEGSASIPGPNVLPGDIGGPDGFGYRYKTSLATGGPAYNWVDISSTGTAVTTWTGSTDDGYAAIPLGTFSFPFYGSTVDATAGLCVSTNGNIQVGTTVLTAFTGELLPTTTLNAGAMCCFWNDMQVIAPQFVKYQDMGDGRFVIQYSFSHLSDDVNPISAEVIIYNAGNILFQYQTVNASGNEPSIGIQGATSGTNFLQWGTVGSLPPGNFAIMFSNGVPDIGLSSSTVNYGTVQVGIPSASTVYVHSTGSLPLNVTNVSTPTNVVPSFVTATINAGDSLALTMTWTPTAEGAMSDNVVVTSNSTANPTINIAVSGTAYIQPGTPNISIAYDLVAHSSTVSWTQPAGTIDGYYVYRMNTTGLFVPSAPRLVATVSGATNTSYIDAGVTGQEYYVVTAFYAGASSSDSQNSMLSRRTTKPAISNTAVTVSRTTNVKANQGEKDTSVKPGHLSK